MSTLDDPRDPAFWDHPDDRNGPWPPPERSTPMTDPLTPGQRVDADLTTLLYDHLFETRHGWMLGGDRYVVATPAQYASLGEDPYAADVPLVLTRVSDEQFVVVDICVMVHPTSPEQADRERRELMEFREAAAARLEANGGPQ